jgi:hypothetical protein
MAQKLLDFINEKPDRINRILFTDEKWFKLGRLLHRQNHRQILKVGSRKKQVTVGHVQKPGRHRHVRVDLNLISEKFMVWAGVSGYGKTKLHFCLEKSPTARNPDREMCKNVDSAYYQAAILTKRALPDAVKIFGHKHWWLQQDWAPAHRSISTTQFIRRVFKRSFDRQTWPSSSPDLTPLDYRIWALMMQRLVKRRYRSKKELKAAVRRAWASITPGELQRIIFEFRRRLELCIQEKGGNFEHLLKKRCRNQWVVD